jgi:hypothetical protein
MDPEIMHRLRTLVADVCDVKTNIVAPRLILDVVEENLVPAFVEAVCEEFEIDLPENFVDDETTFRELLAFINEP